MIVIYIIRYSLGLLYPIAGLLRPGKAEGDRNAIFKALGIEEFG